MCKSACCLSTMPCLSSFDCICQVIAAPAIALAASLMELRAGQTPQHGAPPPQEVLVVPSSLERTSSSFSMSHTVVRAASKVPLVTDLDPSQKPSLEHCSAVETQQCGFRHTFCKGITLTVSLVNRHLFIQIVTPTHGLLFQKGLPVGALFTRAHVHFRPENMRAVFSLLIHHYP